MTRKYHTDINGATFVCRGREQGCYACAKGEEPFEAEPTPPDPTREGLGGFHNESSSYDDDRGWPSY